MPGCRGCFINAFTRHWENHQTTQSETSREDTEPPLSQNDSILARPHLNWLYSSESIILTKKIFKKFNLKYIARTSFNTDPLLLRLSIELTSLELCHREMSTSRVRSFPLSRSGIKVKFKSCPWSSSLPFHLLLCKTPKGSAQCQLWQSKYGWYTSCHQCPRKNSSYC